MALWTPKSRNGLQKPRETPPKMVDYIFDSCVYHFWVDLKPISENRIFRTVLEPFSQLDCRKTKIAFPDLKERSNQKVEENKLALKSNFTLKYMGAGPSN